MLELFCTLGVCKVKDVVFFRKVHAEQSSAIDHAQSTKQVSEGICAGSECSACILDCVQWRRLRNSHTVKRIPVEAVTLLQALA